MTTTFLRDAITRRLDVQWMAFAQRHPHLASAIDRTRLLEQAVADLESDPALTAALGQAAVDQHALDQAERVLQRIDTIVTRLLPVAL